MTIKTQQLKTYGMQQSSFKREIYSYTTLPEEIRKHQIDNLTLHPKQLEKKRRKKPTKISRRKEIIKIWAEISEKEMKEQ